jgi:hypothetical protein
MLLLLKVEQLLASVHNTHCPACHVLTPLLALQHIAARVLTQ